MIDCLTTFLDYLSRDSDLNLLTEGRIAAKHKFGLGIDADEDEIGWGSEPCQALQLTYGAGATPDTSSCATMARARLEARCYGASQVEAAAIYNRLVAISDAFHRCTQDSADGLILLYYLVPDDTAQFDRDPDVRVDFIRVFFQAAVAKTPVG